MKKNHLQIYADMIERGEVIVGEYIEKEINNLLKDNKFTAPYQAKRHVFFTHLL